MTKRFSLPGFLMLLFLSLSGCVTNTGTLTDFDLDGTPDQDDCAPADPDIHPGADDSYGDGIDANCDGVDGNAVDQDDDGYSNGIDCDDRNAHVFPGAEDAAGDGVDSNCDGMDGVAVDMDGDSYSSAVDCNDEDPNIYPGADEVEGNGADDNCDGEIDEEESGGDDDDGSPVCGNGIVEEGEECDDGNQEPFDGCLSCGMEADDDGDGWYEGQDCDDGNNEVWPGAPELCDPLDRDCDGEPFQGATDTSTWYVDRDGDGHGDPNSTVSACQDEGFLEDNTDCDDGNSTVHPNALEICDQIDNNCDGLIDDADPNLDPGATTRWFIDADGDGLGSPDLTAETCLPPSGYQLTDLDCDDSNPAIHPSQVEICDGIDNDCDGAIDDEDPNVYLGTAPLWYLDADNDSFGGMNGVIVVACAAGPGMVSNNDDCDDSNDLVSPAATEICDGIDNDCEGSTDVGAGDATTWYFDADEDGWGRSAVSTTGCTQPANYVGNSEDCDDLNPNRHPDPSGQQDQVCDGLDTDCGGTLTPDELDDDADGFIGCYPLEAIHNNQVIGGGDCNDGPFANWHGGTADGPIIYPGAPELCDGLDNDCDDVIDEGCE